MKTIWKYQIVPGDEIHLSIPEGAEILSVQMQGDGPCVWALADPEANKTDRVFEIYGTGHIVREGKKKFIGTFQMYGGSLVFHLFEKLKEATR